MEPIHYLRALRRRSWVIVAAVAVGAAAAVLTTTTVAPAAAVSSEPTAYTATTVLWNTGAPTIGQGSPITSMDALATIVTLPGVASIVAKELDSQIGPVALASQVQGSVDQASGFLSITATVSTPKRAIAVSTAFADALLTYLQRLNLTRIDQQQKLVVEQINTLQRQGVDPAVIASLRAGLAQLALDRTAPVPISIIQRATAIPVIPPAPAPGGFSAPKSRSVRVLLGALIGLLAGIVLALVLERFDTRIRSARAAEQAFGLTVLAEVPAIPRRRRKKVVTASHPYSRAADAFRLAGLGTARWASNGDGSGNGRADWAGNAPAHPRGAQTILVTSPEARDGKTTVAANLAVALSQTGSRVLVVSCDLRRPAIHESFGVPISPGLTDALQATNGKSDPNAPLDLAPYLEPCSVVRVGVVPSGVTPERPGELLGSPTMERFVARLKKVTDVVILDCAPLVVASDVVPLLPQVDGVVLVARAGKTREELAGNAAGLLGRLGANTAGVVLNDAREFSIPLAKRRMYRPTRSMKKAARKSAAAPRPAEPTIVEQPTGNIQIPDVSPGGDRGSGPSLQASADEPAPWTPPVAPVIQVLAPEREVVIPEAEDVEPSLEVPSLPEVDMPPPEPKPDVGVDALQQELAELRAQLEGLQIDRSLLDLPSPWNGDAVPRPDHEAHHG